MAMNSTIAHAPASPRERSRRLRHGLRLLALACALVVGAVVLAGCDVIRNFNPLDTTSVADAQAARLAAREPKLQAPDIIEDGVLTVGLITSEGAPSVLETSTGYSGIDVDVAAALASELGLAVKYVPLSNDATMALTPVDVVMGVSTAQTGGLVVASDYMEQAIGFFRLGEEPTVISGSELEGQTVGLQTGSASQQLLASSNLQMQETGYANIDEAMAALTAGTVSFVLCPVYPGAFLANELGGISFCGTLDVPTAVGVGVSAQNTVLTDAVQTAMNDVRDNGVLTIILSKWVGTLPRLTAESQVTGVYLGEQTQPDATTSGEAGGNAVTGEDLPQETPEGTEGTEGTENPEATEGTETEDTANPGDIVPL